MVGAVAVAVAGCTVAPDAAPPPGPDNPSLGVVTLQPTEPVDGAQEVRQAQPTTQADCPYLSAAEVEQAIGEKVTRVDIDPSFTPAACFFTATDGSIALVTTMQHFDSEQQAQRLVDDAAPPASTERVDIGQWTGGKTAAAFGALLAVRRGGDVFVVQSTQDRSMAVQRVAMLAVPRVEG